MGYGGSFRNFRYYCAAFYMLSFFNLDSCIPKFFGIQRRYIHTSFYKVAGFLGYAFKRSFYTVKDVVKYTGSQGYTYGCTETLNQLSGL